MVRYGMAPIPFEKSHFAGKGRLGRVHRGKWHGEVAIKVLDMDQDENQINQLAAFKSEV